MKMLNFNNSIADLFRSDFENAVNDSLYGPIIKSRNPMLNISDNETEIIVEMAIPGFKKSELEISVDKNLLIVKGKKDSDTETKKGKFLRKEFSTQEFSRAFRIDPSANQDSISSKLEDGVLSIQIPKQKKIETKKMISIV